MSTKACTAMVNTVKNLVALRVQEVGAPLMHLVRAPIDGYKMLRKINVKH